MIASARTCSTAPSSSRTVTVPADIQALFLDRDGTLIEDRHFVGAVDQVSLLPGTREALARLLAAGTRLFILSNQSGVNRGYFTLADVEAVNRRMIELLDLGPTPFTRICIAPERPDEPSRYRKPSPRFIEEMLAEFSLSRESSWMIGDRPSDWEAGLAARVRVAAITAASPQAEWESRRLTLGIPGYASLLEWADDQRG
jgi:D-glycero-D-manno-heptose 1,7-bisphosphate phosphatase